MASLVNLTPSEAPRDIYSVVLDKVLTRCGTTLLLAMSMLPSGCSSALIGPWPSLW
jgi:hypothetical protein